MLSTDRRRSITLSQPARVQAPKLLDRVRAAIRARHYSLRTEEAYVGWVRRFILFHNKRHPAEMGEAEINQFLTNLAVAGNVAASTQNQALAAILFLYQAVLEKDLDRIDGIVRAKKPKRLPVVLTRDEVRALFGRMSGTTSRSATAKDRRIGPPCFRPEQNSRCLAISNRCGESIGRTSTRGWAGFICQTH